MCVLDTIDDILDAVRDALPQDSDWWARIVLTSDGYPTVLVRRVDALPAAASFVRREPGDIYAAHAVTHGGIPCREVLTVTMVDADGYADDVPLANDRAGVARLADIVRGTVVAVTA